MDIPPKIRKELEGILQKSFKPMSESEIFLTLYSPKMEMDPVPVLQLGLAMLMDKPICVLARTGTEVPENIKKVAIKVEYFDEKDPEGIHKAAVKLSSFAKDFMKDE